MNQKYDCKFYLGIDENGKFVVEIEREDVITNLADEQGELAQIYEVTLKVPAARTTKVTGELPEPKDEPVEIAVAE